MKLDVRPGLAPGKVDLRTTGSTTSPCARLKLGFSVGAAPTPSLPQREVLLLHHEKHLKWSLRWVSHPHGPVYKTGAFLCRPRSLLKWCSREDLHLEPPFPQSGVHILLHFGSLVDWCGMSVLPRRVEFGRLACSCYINAAKLAAGVGSAPTCADFQPAAHLSEPSRDK